MKYTEIQSYLKKLKVFSTKDLKILDDKFNKSKVSNWLKSWYIKQVIRWFYIYWDLDFNQNLLFSISNKIYYPSYISLETAFNYYWIIPEQTFSIISVSTKKTKDFDTNLWYFSYKKIKSNLYWWYKIINIWDNKILIAEIEKAILDYLYLNSNIYNIDDFELLRWNKDILKEKIDMKKLEKYLKMFSNKTLEKKVNLLFNYIKNDKYWIY